jgi:hypothetical protein
MESAKQPATIISLANSIGLVGVTVYFYKQLALMQAQLAQLNTHLSTAIKELEGLKKTGPHIQQLGQAISELNNGLGKLDTLVKTLPIMDDVDVIGDDVDNVIQTLEQSGITVERGSSRSRCSRTGHRERRPARRPVGTKELDDSDDDKRDIDAVRRARQRR